MKVLIAGGGTAGHVFPALAFARRLVEATGADVTFVGTGTGQEARLVPEAGFPFQEMAASPFKRKVSIGTALAPFVLLRSARSSRALVSGADVVVGMGGYASAPPVIAAWRAGRPIVIHEQNAVPGLANRLFSRVARVTALSFGEAARLFPRRARTEVTGNPIRDEIAQVPGNRDALAKESRRELELEEDRRTAVIFGGSQGALRIDQAAVGAIRLLRGRSDLQLVLITGPAHHLAVLRHLPKDGPLLVRAFPFLPRMELAYAVADLVVSRAGAASIAEVTACGLPAVLVPYPYATAGHQVANARAVQRAGGAVVVMDDELGPEVLAEGIEELLGDEERLKEMAERAAAWGRPDAADRMADLVARVASVGSR